MKTIAIIQARVGSTRLPRKVLEDLEGKPMLARVVERTRRARTVDEVIVATTTRPADESIATLCRDKGWPCFRGSEEDVLDRYYQAASTFKADVVIRITSDCPLIEPEIIDKTVAKFQCSSTIDYVSNTLARTYPRGLDVEVFSFEALKKAWTEDNNPTLREHVTPYMYRHPEKFKIGKVVNDIDYSYMRWTVDTVEDLAFVRKIYDHFKNDDFNWRDVLKLLEAHPDWLEINRDVPQKTVP